MEKTKRDEERRRNTRIPAYVLVGFLGSGKTTVLSELIGWSIAQGLKPGLIINEFGDVSIDGEAVRQEGLAMTELTNGCICCTAGDELAPAIQELAAKPEIDLILVEATGLADPADMLDELTDPSLWESVEVGGIISVLDAKRFVDLAEDLSLVRRQVQYADVLIVNKCDLVSEEWREGLLVALSQIVPKARIFLAEGGAPFEGVDAILSHALMMGREKYQQQALVDHHDERGHHDHNHDHDNHDHEHHHGEAHESIHTTSFTLDGPVERARFEHFLEHLPRTIYRAKGFVTLTEGGEPHVFQYMPGFVFVRPFPLRDRDLLRGVFIGRDLDKDWLAEQLKACQQRSVTSW